MPSLAEQLEQLIIENDSRLRGVELDMTRHSHARLRPIFEQLRREFQSAYQDFAETRDLPPLVLDALTQRLVDLVYIHAPLLSEDEISEGVARITQVATSNANRTLRIALLAGAAVGVTAALLPIRRGEKFITDAITDAAKDVLRSDTERVRSRLQQEVRDAIKRGLRTGAPWTATMQEIRNRFNVTRAHMDMLIRTLAAEISDAHRTNTWRNQGVEYEQLVATMDIRVCGYCAGRSGNIYRIGELQLGLHPNCRCTKVPWWPQLRMLRLDDAQWYITHHDVTVQRAKEAGEVIRESSTLTPSETHRGLTEAPEPVWTPSMGPDLPPHLAGAGVPG